MIYKYPCYYCGKLKSSSIKYYSHCCVDCEIKSLIKNGYFVIGDKCLKRLESVNR